MHTSSPSILRYASVVAGVGLGSFPGVASAQFVEPDVSVLYTHLPLRRAVATREPGG